MSPAKRKLRDIVLETEDDSPKHRRSSLRVNLSYASNLSDSGNGSLRQLETVNDSALANNRTRQNESSKRPGSSNGAHNVTRGSVQLKTVKVVLENIQCTERSLDAKCKELREAILNKTKEIYDQHNELALKTALILNHDSPESVDSKKRTAERNNKSSSDNDSKVVNDTGTVGADIFNATSGEQNTTRNVSNSSNVNKRQLRKRLGTRLGNSDAQSNITEQRFDIPNKGPGSPILSGSSKRLVRAKRKTNDLSTFRDKFPSQSSISSISEDENMFATPICSSTIIAQDREHAEDDMQSELNDNVRDCTRTKRSPVSMELTDMRGGFLIENEPTDERPVANQESITTVRTSLYVNTSIDTRKSNNRMNDAPGAVHTAEDEDRLEIEESCTMQTIRTSLQMNTSLNSSCLRRRNYRSKDNEQSLSLKETVEDKNAEERSAASTSEAVAEDSLENISLIERLRNISMPTAKQKRSSTGKRTSEVRNSPLVEVNQNRDASNSISHQDSSLSVHEERETNLSFADVDDSPTEETQASNCADHSCKTIMLGDYVNARNKNNTEHPTVTAPRKNKKKLLPLMESSQPISLIPNEEMICTPVEPRVRKNWKIRRGRFNKMHKKVNEHNAKKGADENSCTQLPFQDGTDVFQDKKRKGKSKKNNENVLGKNIVSQTVRTLRTVNIDGNDRSSGRRENSLNDFQRAGEQGTKSQTHKSQKLVIVATGLSKEDKALVKAVVKTLGSARLEGNVSRRTTHVVTTGVRTINLLHGIVRGCWLVSLEWVLKSLEKSTWLRPDEFEMAHFSKAVKENRKDRQLFGPAYVPELFAACGFLHVETNTIPPCSVLKDLIKAAGGRLTENPKVAKIVVGKKGIRESWVLDSITTGELQSCNEYRRTPP